MKKLNLIKRLLSYSHEKQSPQRFGRYAVMLMMLLTLGVGQMWAGNWIGNCGVYVNGTWYKSSSNSDGGWLKDNTSFENYNFGAITSLVIGGQYDAYHGDDGAVDYCSWNSNNGIWITIKKGSDEITNFKLSCFNSGKSGNNNVWKTYGEVNGCSDSNEGWNTYTVDISDYAAGQYTIKASWTSPESQSLNNTANFTINPVVTFKANGGTGSDYTQTVTYNSATALTANTFSRTGYTFLGWATSADGDVVYADGANVTLTAHTDLYAKWGQQSLTITSHPDYLTTTSKLNLSIEYANIPSGYCYRVKVGAGYYNNSSGQDRDAISGTGSTTFTSNSGLPLGANTVVVELWKNSPFEKQSVVSDGVTVTVEQAYLVNVQAKTDGVESTTGGTVSPASVNASAHLGQTITASEPNTGYDFRGWTADPDENITFADASALSTTVYAAAGGWVRANYVRQSGSYSTTFYAGDHGSINAKGTEIAKNGNASVTIGNNEPLSATPESAEYVFDHWETTGTVSVANRYSATTTVTATAAGGTVTAYYRHVPELGAVTATPSGTQNYAGEPINFALSVTSTYLAHPVVVFWVNDGTTTYEVVGAPYGADGSSAAGTIGSDAAYTTVHKATFTASAAHNYTVSAKLYEGLLVENFETADYTSWESVGGGSSSIVSNLSVSANNGSPKVRRITPNGEDWKTSLTRSTAKWANGYQYIHTKMYYTAGGELRFKISDAPVELAAAHGTNGQWNKVVFNNSGKVNIDFMFPWIVSNTSVFYIDDIILSNEASMTVKASQAATASFSINWNYTVTLNNNGATSAGTESVNVIYGSATGITDITVPTKTGYTFGGYYTEDAGAGTQQINASGVWQNGGYVADGKWHSGSNQTLYAKWTANTYTVQYNANGGTGDAMGNSDLTYNAGALSTNTYTRAGYTFSGWNTEANGSGSSYSDGQTNPNVSATNGATVTLFAQWSARPYKIVYFAKPADWTNVYAYAWKSSNGSVKNDEWPGKQLDAATPIAGTGTEVINCATYYYYKYYTDGGSADAEGLVGNSEWDKVIFNNGDNQGVANNTKTSNLNLVSGNLYGVHTSMQSTSADGYSSSAKWTLRGSFNLWSGETYPFSCGEDEHSYSVLVEGLTASTNYSFKIWGPDGVAYKYTGGKDESCNPDYSVTSLLDGRDLVLNEYASNNNTFTTATTSYLFTLDVTDPKHPVLTIVPGDDADYSVTMAVSGHGKITTPGTGSKTIHRYAPTTITAVADPGYRFTGWTVDGAHSSYVTFGNASSLSTNVTGVDGAAGATITANFSNDGFVYFDASAVSGFSGGGKVYVTYLKSNDLSWDGATDALIVKNYISSDLHNQEMTRIPNSNIFYFYTSTTPQGKILFTSKSHDGTDYKLWDMAAVVREDFNVGQDNMFVAENWVLKDKNKTGYYDGYWMKYNESDPGVKLEIYSMGACTPRISGSPFSFTRTEEGSRIYTTKVTGLTANTQYGIEILGNNGTYYKNSGEMTSTNATGGWDYVDRQPTRGTIRTTAAGDYDVQLSCADKLILTVDFPLAVNDYQVVYSGKDSVGGSTTTNNASTIIRHIGAVGTKKDTVSFFVVKGDSWTLQLQKCTAVSPEITWANVGEAKTASNFGTPETGVYNFVVKQDSTTGTPVTPTFATMTPEAYTGNYYIRTDAADGGWEAYKKSMDNRMVFSNYSKQHSNYDYYHCKYKTSGKNVKFCIANDYSGSLSAIKTTDTYVTNIYGNLPADANIRFMYNSETNVVNRAYLNGSSTTDFLVLEAKNDSIKNTDDSSIDKVEVLNQVKFADMGNWVYQKEVKALEGTHYRLTSNYRYGSPETNHIQYFKGASGDWTQAHTEPLIGGTGTSWQKLRLVYDFKTNNLVAAWMPDGEVGSDLAIHADMMLIRRAQNAATQLTFATGKSLSDVKTMVGAVEFFKDSIVGRVGNFGGDVIGAKGNRANRELMLYISFPFDVAVNDIYGCGDYNKEWYIQYYDGAERASKGWFKGDGTTTFWKFIDRSDTLRAGVGYSLLLDNDYFNTNNAGVWKNIADGGSVYLFFPSAKELDGSKVIKTGSAALPVPSHECTIDRTFVSANSSRTVNHKFTDSHWNMMGVPLFQNETGVGIDQFIPKIDKEDEQELIPFPANTGYFYEWDSLGNTLSVRTTESYTFKSMHSYMVQFTGTVAFSGSSIQPASSVAARRTKLNRDNYTIELQLLQNNKRVSRTYVELREEACDTFALNEDVYMMYSALPANLYTFAGNYDVSANVLSVNDHTIPVGITVRNAGTYTFTMPSDFNGSVTLIDNVENTRTNLALSDYEVTLPKGVCEGRFALEIDVNKTPTSIDVIEDGGSLKDGKAHKFIMNGQMYILKNGELFDATGRRVK